MKVQAPRTGGRGAQWYTPCATTAAFWGRDDRRMERGLRLACEQCDFSVTLYERIPFVVDADGKQQAVTSPGRSTVAGYWTDSLCGECRLPVRLAHLTAPEPEDTVDLAVCPRCGAAPIPFEIALRELAEASHSRAWLDLATEREARERLVAAIERAHALGEDIERGDTTTFAALDELARQISPEAEDADIPATRMPLARTHTLDGLNALIENAFTVEQASSTMEERLRTSAVYMQGLETCVEDEGSLLGVPCPQCGTGHLVHWPVWL